MVKEAERCAKEDEEMRKKYELKNEIESLAFGGMPESDKEEILDWLSAKKLTERTVAELEDMLKQAGQK